MAVASVDNERFAPAFSYPIAVSILVVEHAQFGVSLSAEQQ